MNDESKQTLQKSVRDIFFKPKVLVIDDEARIQKACHRLLTQEGCDVELADNGIKGLKMIEDHHFDIILLDLMMPGISGLEVLRDVKSRHPDTVVIIITGYATLEHSIETMKNGAFDFLSKPFSPQELRVVISKAIEFIRTLQDIATEKSRMRVMINTLRDGVLTTDNQKRIALANPAFLQMIGCRKRSVIGQKVSDIIKEKTLLDMIDQAISQPEDTFAEITEELVFPLAENKTPSVIGVRCLPFRDRLNRNLGSVTVFHDITALKEIDRLKSDFVSMVAHEIKSPLGSILLQLDVILDGLAGDLTEKQIDMLTKVTTRIRGLTRLSSELLDLSKIESGLINQERQALELGELIRSQVSFYREKADAKSIHLSMEKPKQKIHIMGNLTNIEEVISNLISNAIRYSPKDGKIDISLCEKSDCAQIKVSDTGFGIPEKDLPNIFDKFFRSKNKNTRFINGTGLGLAIVKSIIDAHHGTIEVESTVDKGSTFTLLFPKADYTV